MQLEYKKIKKMQLKMKLKKIQELKLKMKLKKIKKLKLSKADIGLMKTPLFYLGDKWFFHKFDTFCQKLGLSLYA